MNETFKTNDWIFTVTDSSFAIFPRPGGTQDGKSSGASVPRKDMGAALVGLGIVQIAVAQWEEPKPGSPKPEEPKSFDDSKRGKAHR